MYLCKLKLNMEVLNEVQCYISYFIFIFSVFKWIFSGPIFFFYIVCRATSSFNFMLPTVNVILLYVYYANMPRGNGLLKNNGYIKKSYNNT